MGKCPNCGAPIENGACSYCGMKVSSESQSNAIPAAQVQQPQIIINNVPAGNAYQPQNIVQPQPKSKITALILCILLGGLGIHQFYAGKAGMGILYLFTGGLFCIGWIVDIIRIVTGSFRDSRGILLQ